MKKTALLALLLTVTTGMFAQIGNTNFSSGGDTYKPKKKEKPPINLYRIISAQRDTTHVDTTLSIKKEYKYNYLRRDDFELCLL